MPHRLDPRRIEILDRDVLSILRRKTPAERIAMGVDCDRTARQLLAARLSEWHPEWSPTRLAAEVSRRLQRGSV